jgi:hypothetical protein
MNRFTIILVSVVTAGVSGCMTPAHYVEKGTDQGIVAIPEWSNEWPTFYKDAAVELIKQRVGSSFEIVDKYVVVVGGSSNSPSWSSDPSSPIMGSSSTQTEYRIVYRKKPVQPGVPLGSSMPAGYSGRPLQPAGAGMGLGTVPAGGFVPGSVTGGGTASPGIPTNPYVPSVSPVANPYQGTPPGVNPYAPGGRQ